MDLTYHDTPPLISVIMCVYNTRPYIEAAVESIINQSYPHWELIISDDCSTDGSREWLKKLEAHPKIRIFLQDKNIGYVPNKNFAIKQARGTYITQNDSDDLSSPDRLEQQVAIVMQNPQIKIVACGFQKIDSKGNIYQSIHAEQDTVIEKYDRGYPFWFPPLLVHQEVYKKIGVFTSYFAGMGDDLYWTAKANELYPIYCLKASLYQYRDNPTSITNVLNEERKLIVWALLDVLLSQRVQTGSDWLEKKDMKVLLELESSFLQNKKFMSEQYRIWAAKAVDKCNWEESRRLIKAAFVRNPFNTNWYRTTFYYLRKKFGSI